MQRISWAIVLLCLVQALAFSHGAGTAEAEGTEAGNAAMAALREHHDATVSTFKLAGNADSLRSRAAQMAAAFELAGAGQPAPLPPDPPDLSGAAISSTETSGNQHNSRRAVSHISAPADQHRRLGTVDGTQKKSSKPAGARSDAHSSRDDAGTNPIVAFLTGQATVAMLLVVIVGVATALKKLRDARSVESPPQVALLVGAKPAGVRMMSESEQPPDWDQLKDLELQQPNLPSSSSSASSLKVSSNVLFKDLIPGAASKNDKTLVVFVRNFA